MALLFPPQGSWTEDDYLALNTNRLIELSDGCLEVLPMPSLAHQLIVAFLYERLMEFLAGRGMGRVVFAPLPVHLKPGEYREPDIVYLRPGQPRHRVKYPRGSDLVMEVVSEGAENRDRDLETKRQEYAAAGIQEYWIVDPEERKVIVLVLDGTTYRVHGEFKPGSSASSVLLSGFSVAVDAVLAAADEEI